MQYYDLHPNILFSIFVSLDISEAVTKQYLEWHHSLDPSFHLLKTLITQYLNHQNKSNLKSASTNCLKIISKLMLLKFPRNLIRAFLHVIKQNRSEINQFLNTKEILQNWKNISIDLLEYYLQGFDIQIVSEQKSRDEQNLSIEMMKKRVHELIGNKEYDSAILLIKILGYPEEQLRELFTKMANSKEASKAANFMKTHKIDHNLYPQVGDRLNKNMIRHFLKSQGWQAAQEIFYDHNEALACLIQDLLFKQKKKEAISIWYRHQQAKQYIVKTETLEFFKTIEKISQEQLTKDILVNSYFVDYFGPSNKEKYLTLQQYGIDEDNVTWIGHSQSKQMNFFIDMLNSSHILALDTESIVGKTKLQRSKHEPVSIVQVAFQKHVFILDGITCKNQKLKEAFYRYNKSQKLILGHALDNDMQGFFLAMGFDQKELKQIKIEKQIDTCKLYKSIYPNERYSNLAHICLKVLGKEVCKKQTLTNWNRRPLRSNQMHYAAMDAFCVLKIYSKLLQDVGQNMLSYFLQQDI